MARSWESIQVQAGTTRTSSLPPGETSEGGHFDCISTETIIKEWLSFDHLNKGFRSCFSKVCPCPEEWSQSLETARGDMHRPNCHRYLSLLMIDTVSFITNALIFSIIIIFTIFRWGWSLQNAKRGRPRELTTRSEENENEQATTVLRIFSMKSTTIWELFQVHTTESGRNCQLWTKGHDKFDNGHNYCRHKYHVTHHCKNIWSNHT